MGWLFRNRQNLQTSLRGEDFNCVAAKAMCTVLPIANSGVNVVIMESELIT